MSQNVIVGGDFKKLLNALSHVDEAALAEVLPYRRGQKGLHLVEAVAQAVRAPDAVARVELATTWFRDDLAAMEKEIAVGGSIEGRFVALGDPKLEARAVDLLRPHLRIAGKPVAAPAEKKKSGLFGWFSRK